MVEIGRGGHLGLWELKNSFGYQQFVAQGRIVVAPGMQNGIWFVPNAALFIRFCWLVEVCNISIGVAGIVVEL